MRADHEPSPLRCVTQEDVDRIYHQICNIPAEYKRVKTEDRFVVTNLAVGLLNKIKSKSSGDTTKSVDRQAEADALAAKATEIYSMDFGTKKAGLNPDQHEERQALK